ncbi:MAG: hypothetical protein KGI67_09435 [Pseudomonadota bacterium]|nr:hypothetical protein [Pseudomonadota bacterium]
MTLLALLPALLAAPAAHAIDAYAGIGTTGFLLGVEHHYTDAVGVRADISGASISRDVNDNSGTYHGTAHLAALGLFADYHPWGSGFRLSAGALVGDTHIDASGVASATGTYNINGVAVSAPGESLAARIKLPSVRPFIGLGWGHTPKSTGLFGQFDLGVAYGRPDVTLTATPNLAAAALNAGTSVDAERALLQAKADDYRLFPVIRVGLGWAW